MTAVRSASESFRASIPVWWTTCETCAREPNRSNRSRAAATSPLHARPNSAAMTKPMRWRMEPVTILAIHPAATVSRRTE